MCAKKNDYDEEALFAHTRMSLGDHIEELRSHLWKAIKGFLVAMVLGFLVAKPVLGFLVSPLEKVLRQMRIDRLNAELDEAKNAPARAPTNVRVKREDLAAAVEALHGPEADDTITVRLHAANGEELRQRVRAADLTAALNHVDTKTGGNWVTIPFLNATEVVTRQYFKIGPLARALGLPTPKDEKEWVAVPVATERDEEIKRQIRKADLKAAQKNEGGEWLTLSSFTREDDEAERQIIVTESEKVHQALIALSITEPFMIWFKVSLYTGFVLASPWVFYQIWSFIAAGLYPHEKKYIHIFLPMSIVLFILGVCLCQFVVLPLGIRWLLDFSEWVGVKPDLRLSEWLTFALLVPLIFGLAFQLPLIMFGMERVGFFTIETYQSKRRIAIFLIFLISGLANASPDPISMTFLAVPLCLLYELGILMCRMWPKPELDLDVEEDSEEVAEV